jgi:hypothetical protein
MILWVDRDTICRKKTATERTAQQKQRQDQSTRASEGLEGFSKPSKPSERSSNRHDIDHLNTRSYRPQKRVSQNSFDITATQLEGGSRLKATASATGTCS